MAVHPVLRDFVELSASIGDAITAMEGLTDEDRADVQAMVADFRRRVEEQ